MKIRHCKKRRLPYFLLKGEGSIFNYFESIENEVKAVNEFLSVTSYTEWESVNKKCIGWRTFITEVLLKDFTPHLKKQDLLPIIRTLSYYKYEISQYAKEMLKNGVPTEEIAVVTDLASTVEKQICKLSFCSTDVNEIKLKAFSLHKVWQKNRDSIPASRLNMLEGIADSALDIADALS